MKKINFSVFFALLVIFPVFCHAKTIGSHELFYTDSSYDELGRGELQAKLISQSDRAYFYVEDDFYNELSSLDKINIRKSLSILGKEFDDNISPKLRSFYGDEWNPGIDNDRRVYILFHILNKDSAGYFRERDQYYKEQISDSNEKEIVYLNLHFINKKIIKSYLAHEFTHLITFNQKNRIIGVVEDVWIAESRSEYAPTIVGYNNEYDGSYLKTRVNRFLQNPGNSFMAWDNSLADYASINLFSHYFADHYGNDFLKKILYSKRTDYNAFNEILENKKLSRVFVEFNVANLINDCSLSEYFCYKNKHLSNLRIVPKVNFLPIGGESSLRVSDKVENWSAKWHKVIGGSDSFSFEFEYDADVNFAVPYLLEKKDKSYEFGYLNIADGVGKLSINDYSSKYMAFYFIPTVLNDPKKINGEFSYTWVASSKDSTVVNNQELIDSLMTQIQDLQKQLIILLQREILKLKALILKL